MSPAKQMDKLLSKDASLLSREQRRAAMPTIAELIDAINETNTGRARGLDEIEAQENGHYFEWKREKR